MNQFFLELDLNTIQSNQQPQEVTDNDLKTINNLNKNAPLRKLHKNDIHTRSILILGEEPTSKGSIHPQRILNNRKIHTLSTIAKLLPGSPMMVGHRLDKTPWGRTFRATVIQQQQGYTGAVLNEDYWFINDPEGQAIARKIDGGIWSEGSISYWFKEARCSICHKTMASISFLDLNAKIPRCKHKIGQKDPDTGQICYWYPYQIQMVAETSYVFKGAYTKTKSFLNTPKDELLVAYSPDAVNAAIALETQLLDCGLDLNPNTQINTSNNDPDNTDTAHNHPNNNDPNNTTTPPNTSHPTTTTDNNHNTTDNTPIHIDTNTTIKQPHTEPKSTPNPPDTNPIKGDINNDHTQISSQIQNTHQDQIQEPKNATTNIPHHTNSNHPQGNDPTPPLNHDLTRGKGPPKGGPKQRDGGASKCICPQCGYQQTHDRGNPCADIKCPKCNTPLEGKNQYESPDSNIFNNPDNIDLNPLTTDTTPHATENPETTPNTTPTQPQQQHETSDTDTIKFFHALSDTLGSAETAALVSAVLLDTELDFDEKETALRDILVDSPIPILNTVLQFLSTFSISFTEKQTGLSPQIKICSLCGDDFALDQTGPCPNCDGELTLFTENKAVLFQPVGPLKPKKAGDVNNEFFTQEAFRDLPDATYFVAPSYDGVWMELHRKGDDVKIFTDESTDYSLKFPKLVAEAKALKTTHFILVGELTRWRGRQRLTHSDVTAWLHTKQDAYDDKDFKFKTSDILLCLGQDLTRDPLDSRRTRLDAVVKWGTQIHPTAHRVIKHKKGAAKIILAINDRKTRDGATIKNTASKYLKADQNLLYNWKQQYEIDARVTHVVNKTGGGSVYSCEVGRGPNTKKIGPTFATKIKAVPGDIIKLSVDHVRYDKDTDTYSWFAPTVISLRPATKFPDPLTTLKKMVRDSSASDSSNIITLTEVIPRLKRAALDVDLFLAGAIVEEGLTTHEIHIVTKQELTPEQVDAILTALGPRLSQSVDITYGTNGPAGPAIPILADPNPDDSRSKHSNNFVLQEHGWGKKVHFDLRFADPRTNRVWGWTCFTMPPTEAGVKKTRCQEKQYHDSTWMDVDAKSIQPGDLGNPTKNLIAWMTKLDTGTYEYIRRKPQFMELILHGKKLTGRYVFREIEVTLKSTTTAERHQVHGDEVGVKTDNIWIMWKPKDQNVSAPIKKLAYRMIDDCLAYWETDDIDTQLQQLEDVPIETEIIDRQ